MKGAHCADPVETKCLDIPWRELVDNKVLLQDLKWFGDRLSDLISKSSYLVTFLRPLESSTRDPGEHLHLFMLAIGASGHIESEIP